MAYKDIDRALRDRLFVAGFEQVLVDLQLSSDPDDHRRHNALITAVVGIFYGMNNGFMHTKFEFEDPPQVAYSLQSFLSRFHALFTLNQDALIEQHYAPVLGCAWIGAGYIFPVSNTCRASPRPAPDRANSP